jgi:hypothetical protein
VDVGWYLRRLSRMGPREAAGRIEDVARRTALRPNPGRIGPRSTTLASPETVAVPSELAPEPAAALVVAADRLLQGIWPVAGHDRTDMAPVPDWFLDPVTGIRAPDDRFAPSIEFRDPSVVGSIKRVWEPSRHQHLTVLAAAYAITGDTRYAEMVDRHLRDWIARDPFMKGVHWTSGIEVGIRLISWVWARRLLSEWEGSGALFERNPDFVRQCYQHQYFLSTFPSHGSSANNHLVAEAAGQLVASCAFPIFPESRHWEKQARETLEKELQKQTFPTGLNRELATDYHGFVMELALVAGLEAGARGTAMTSEYWTTLRRMSDALAAVVDSTFKPPRQGDSDEGRGLLIDAPTFDRWTSLLSIAESLFGAQSWWPEIPEAPSIASVMLPRMPGKMPPITQPRPDTRLDVFADAGMILLRTDQATKPELWVRFDCGPHGYLSIASHAHADALSVEVRFDGVEVLADPGTYAYHSAPDWRRYFRTTAAHNTLVIDGVDQSEPGGPFMWTTHAEAWFTVPPAPWSDVVSVTGSHGGYGRLASPATHHRSVLLDRDRLLVRIVDEIESEGAHEVGLYFHLGPAVDVRLQGARARLDWGSGTADLDLPESLTWDLHRGEEDPPLGWFSPSFGVRVPSWTLVGQGHTISNTRLSTGLQFGKPSDRSSPPADT